jgi:hypothetical protein
VERGQPDLAAVLPHQPLHALAHFVGGLVRERDGEDLVRRDAAFGDEVRDPVRNDARLPGPGAGQDEQRPVLVEYGFTLRRIE